MTLQERGETCHFSRKSRLSLVLYLPMMVGGEAAAPGLVWNARGETMDLARMGWRGARLLAKNITVARRWHLLRFRLVTFGLYEPHPWHRRQGFAHRWWQINPRVA